MPSRTCMHDFAATFLSNRYASHKDRAVSTPSLVMCLCCLSVQVLQPMRGYVEALVSDIAASPANQLPPSVAQELNFTGRRSFESNCSVILQSHNPNCCESGQSRSSVFPVFQAIWTSCVITCTIIIHTNIIGIRVSTVRRIRASRRITI